MCPSASMTLSARAMVVPPSVFDPLPHVASVAVALARHLRPAGEQPRGGQQQPVAQMGGIVAILLERGVADLLVVRIVLEFAGGEQQDFAAAACDPRRSADTRSPPRSPARSRTP